MTPKEALRNLLAAIEEHGAGTFVTDTENEEPTRRAIGKAMTDAQNALGEQTPTPTTPISHYQQRVLNWAQSSEYEIWADQEALDEPYSNDLLKPGASAWMPDSHDRPLRYRTVITIPYHLNDTRRAQLLNSIHRLLAEYMEETQGDE